MAGWGHGLGEPATAQYAVHCGEAVIRPSRSKEAGRRRSIRHDEGPILLACSTARPLTGAGKW